MNKKNSLKQWFSVGIGFLILGAICWAIFVLGRSTIALFASLEPAVLASLITASVTAIGAVLAVVVGRYYQVKYEEKIAHRDKKIELYDTVVSKLFDIFTGNENSETEGDEPDDLVAFLRETQKDLILWSGPNALLAYADWHKVLTGGGEPRAITMTKMLDFFLALRSDLGHSNKRLKYDHLVRLLVRSPDLFMEMYRENPETTFDEIAKMAKEKGLE